MKKLGSELTYKDFINWANYRACDGAWGIVDALGTLNFIHEIDNHASKNVFGIRTNRNKEKYFQEHKNEWINNESIFEW